MRLPESWERAGGTLAIAGVTALAWIGVVLAGREQWAAVWGGFIPARALGAASGQALAPFWLTPLTATLLHGSILHLGFNILIFAFCSRAVEGALGPTNLIILYLVGAYTAAAGQYAMDPTSIVPMIGASGAISAVIGAYAMLFGRNRVRVARHRLAVWLNALWLLVAWVVLQVAMGLVLGESDGLLLAVGAHVGGFVAGLALARPMLLWKYRKA